MSTQITCIGLPAGWINAWLAAVGATVLDPRVRLHWTARGHQAVLSSSGVDPLDALVESWPDRERLSNLPIAEHWRQAGELRRKVPVESFVQRAQSARSDPHSWTLSSTMTDLCVDHKGEVTHAPLDPAGPGTVKWLHHRLMKIHGHLQGATQERLRASLMGEANRVKDNGLGFDQARLGSQADDSDRWTDPVVEVLAFFGLAVFPMRGRGTDARRGRRAFGDGRQRGWRRGAVSGEPRRLHWPTWSQPLDAHGIDALLDVWNPDRKSQWPLFGVHAGWKTVSFRATDRADPTRALGAEAL